jgi:hypothetical protein
VISIIFMIRNNILEKFSSQGALTQLYAKGPQDLYLSGDAWKHLYWQYPFGYPNFIWNNPTRLNNNYYDHRYTYRNLLPKVYY